MEAMCPSPIAKSLPHGPTSHALSPRCQIIIGPTLMKQAAPEPNMATFYEGVVGQGLPWGAGITGSMSV